LDRQAPDCFPPSEVRRPCYVGWHLIFRFSIRFDFHKVWRLLGVAEKVQFGFLIPGRWRVTAELPAAVLGRTDQGLFSLFIAAFPNNHGSQNLLNIYCECADGLV
ncbi:MAG: hypothetical protein ACLP9L_27380, partial [Thermoguttaceae bacterium]